MPYLIAIGSNLGDRFANLANALEALTEVARFCQISKVYESSALLPPFHEPSWDVSFLNMAISCESKLSSSTLMNHLKLIEKNLGREEKARWAPRIIDLDILFAGPEIINTKHLSIPHPEVLLRDFALVPAAELAPHFQHPLTKKTLISHARDLYTQNKIHLTLYDKQFITSL